MNKIVETLYYLFSMVSNFLPPTIWYIFIPFVGLAAFFKIVREVK